MEVPHLGVSNRLLDSLPAAETALLKSQLKTVTMVQGTLLQEQGDQIGHVYFPQSGMISLLAVMKQGQSVEIATVGREGAVGAMSGFGSRHAFTRAIVQVDGAASRISTAHFQEAMKKSATLRETVACWRRCSKPPPATRCTISNSGCAAGCCKRRIAPAVT